MVTSRIAGCALSFCLLLSTFAQNPPSAAQMPEQPKEIPVFDIDALDRTADPCADFYQFACGKWTANNPIPPDQSVWGRFNELQERNLATLRGILEKASNPSPQRTPVYQKVGDYYASCMDEAAIEKKGTAVLKTQLDRIAELKDVQELPELIGYLHHIGIGALFSFDSGQDFKDATQVIGQADQGGLGLPDRDYYFNTDAKSVELRKQYLQHVQRMLELLNEAPAKAASDAKTVMDIETGLAKVSMKLVDRRDPVKIYHKMAQRELQALSPRFTWSKYFVAADVPPVQSLNVAVPEFFRGANQLLADVPIQNWQTYLRWQVVHGTAPFLPQAFVDENFDFFGRKLTGAQELKARWKRCVQAADADLGFALGQPFVEETFGAEGKQRTLQMVQELEKALGQDIQAVTWMTPPTKQQAENKLAHIANKIGYPDRWRDYSKLEIIRGDAMGNSLRANAFDFQRRMNKIGKPLDRGEWEMTPPTVNAYYNPLMNDINFPAGILQPPFYSNRADDALNFGGMGAVIGHELTHGFDDEGRQFDASGNLRDWWTQQDGKAFEQHAQCIIDEYSGFTAVDEVKLNGKLTEGENIADNGGVRIAFMALNNSLKDKDVPPVDGFTPQQRFFLGWGQVWCQNQKPEVARLRAQVDPHSPGRWRVNGVLRNMPEFQQAWGCKAGQSMVPANACRVW